MNPNPYDRLLGLANRIVDKASPPRFRLHCYSYLYHLNMRREREIDFVTQLADKSGIALDIGANIGLYTFQLGKHCRHVHAFEPNPDMARVIEAACLPNVEVHKKAISGSNSREKLYIPRRGKMLLVGWASLERSHCKDAEAFEEIEITCIPLDSLELKNVSFVKLDVEGHELAALRGAINTLSENRPVVLAEIELENRQEFVAQMQALGYREHTLRALFGVEGTPANLLFISKRA